MNECIEFHDSTLRTINQDGATCVIELSRAYVHRSKGRPAIDAGSVFQQDFQIIMDHAVVRGKPVQLPARLDSGELKIGNITLSNIVPTATKGKKKICLQLFTMLDGGSLEVEGASIVIRARGEAFYLEKFPGK